MSTNKYRIPELRSSLCGCSLETASKIIGWFNLVFDSLTVLGAIIVNIGLMSYYESKEYREAEAKNNDAMMIFLAGFGVLAWFVAFYGILQVLINLLLLKGVYEKKSSYIWPWVVCQLVCVVFSLIFDLFFDYNIRKQVSNHPGDLAVSIVAEIFGLVITLYCIWLVYSYYRQLKRQNDDLPAYEPHVYPV